MKKEEIGEDESRSKAGGGTAPIYRSREKKWAEFRGKVFGVFEHVLNRNALTSCEKHIIITYAFLF